MIHPHCGRLPAGCMAGSCSCQCGECVTAKTAGLVMVDGKWRCAAVTLTIKQDATRALSGDVTGSAPIPAGTAGQVMIDGRWIDPPDRPAIELENDRLREQHARMEDIAASVRQENEDLRKENESLRRELRATRRPAR